MENILDEFKLLEKTYPRYMWDESIDLIKYAIKNGYKKDEIAYFKVLVKLYTGSVYKLIGNFMSENNYEPIAFYLSQMI